MYPLTTCPSRRRFIQRTGIVRYFFAFAAGFFAFNRRQLFDLQFGHATS
jgi:hypothetical protein